MPPLNELVVTLTVAGIGGLVWVAWKYPSTFSTHFQSLIVASPILAMLLTGAFVLGYDAHGWGLDFPAERQAMFLGLIAVIGLLAALIWWLSRISPHKDEYVAGNKRRKQDDPKGQPRP